MSDDFGYSSSGASAACQFPYLSGEGVGAGTPIWFVTGDGVGAGTPVTGLCIRFCVLFLPRGFFRLLVGFDAPKLQPDGFLDLIFVTGEGVGAGIFLIFRGLGVAFGNTPLLASVVVGSISIIDIANDAITVAIIIRFSFFISFLSLGGG